MSRSSTPYLAAQGVSYRLPDGRLLFRDLTLGFDRGITAAVGPNGSGKSTLLALLRGSLLPSSGVVHRAGPVAFLPQRPDRVAGGRVVDLLGVGPAWDALARLERGSGDVEDLARVDGAWDLPARVLRLVEGVGLPTLGPEVPVSGLSGGEITRLALAGLAWNPGRILLLDEPTNHLDRATREWVGDHLEAHPGGVVVVTHDRGILARAHRVLELGSGPEPRIVTGGLDAWMEARETRERTTGEALERARLERARVRRDAARKGERQARRSASGARAARTANQPKVLLGARARQAQATTGRLRAREDRAVEEAGARVHAALEAHHPRRRPRFVPAPSGLEGWREVLVLDAVRARGLFGPLHRRWVGPARVALTGPNGSGKSTLLGMLAGARTPDSGQVTRGLPSHRIVHLPQLPPALTGVTVLGAFQAAHPGVTEPRGRELLDALLFGGAALSTPVEVLSQGERVRLAFALSLGGDPTPGLLLLDEPTNHLDLESVEALEALLRGWDGSLVVASHDEDFLEGIGVSERLELG
jgi:ATPase subunit of ABC transporter with duplicated ATPase domains